MNQNIFKPVSLVDRSFFQKIFKQQPEENAVIELNNLFAVKAVMDVSEKDISQIESKYKITLANEFPLNLEEFYATYYNYCFEDKNLSNDDKEQLKHLKQILSLDDNTIAKLESKIGEVIYKKSYDEAIANGELTKEKEALLKQIKTDLKLPEETTKKISDDSRKGFMDALLKKIVADQRVSPDDWNKFTTTAKNLEVTINMDSEATAQLEKFKLYWLIENGELPVKQVDISLQKGEVCYYSGYADWLEHRTVTTRVNYSGPVLRVRIMKGLSYRVGSANIQRITEDQMKVIDSGTVYLTNKRVIFVGRGKNSNIKLDKILSIVPYSDGVEIEKDTGKSPSLRVSKDADILAMTLSRLINDAH